MGDEPPLREIREEDPELFLAMAFREVRSRSESGFETAAFLEVAEGLAAERGLNLARAVNDNPGIVASLLEEELALPESTVAALDRIVDEEWDGAERGRTD